MDTIRAFLKEYASEEDVFTSQLVENITRLNMTVMEEAEGYERALKMGIDIEDLAEKVGKSVATIAADIDLCRLPTIVKKALDSGEVPKAVGRKIAELPDNKMLTAFTRAMRNPKNVKTMLAGIEAYLEADGQVEIGFDYTKFQNDPEIKEQSEKFDRWWKRTKAYIGQISRGERANKLVKAKLRNLHVLKLTVQELSGLTAKLSDEITRCEAQMQQQKAA